MPRPKIDLENWKDAIELRIVQGLQQTEIVTWLNEEEGVRVSLSTLQRQLQQWGFQSHRTQVRNSLQNISFSNAVHDL